MNPALSDPLLKCRFLWISHSQLLVDEAGLEERHHLVPSSPGSLEVPLELGTSSSNIHLEFGAGLKSCSNIHLILEVG